MIIQSLCDTDLYKLTMMQAVLHQFPGAEVTYRFFCRDDLDVRSNMLHIYPYFKEEVERLCSLRFTENELEYLSGIRFMKRDFIEFLRLFQLNPNFIKWPDPTATEFGFEIKGPWFHTILFETPLLAIISELWCAHIDPYSENKRDLPDIAIYLAESNMRDMIAKMKDIRAKYSGRRHPYRVVEFGTRRRYSRAWQERALEMMLEAGMWSNDGEGLLFGTSNVDLARRFGIRCFGTMAHEWLQAGQGCGVQLQQSQIHMLEIWAKEYRGDLGIAITDVIGMKAFCRDFDLYLAKLYDGLRHDSGCPKNWYDEFLALYKDLNIKPDTKQAVFSDGLTPDSSEEVYAYTDDRSPSIFAMETALTNSCGVTAPKIVIKMTHFNGKPVAKVSDSPGKGMCGDQQYLDYLKKVFNVT
jgi:nicotinate phosphoribosyltransferase